MFIFASTEQKTFFISPQTNPAGVLLLLLLLLLLLPTDDDDDGDARNNWFTNPNAHTRTPVGIKRLRQT